ncbi:hypothetical protein ACH47Z_06510 [Streptomyces sp. NPDC020192]|uniref:hypothetical protein n=1 Tax=Streptomyces sp. NPDC020192 TaxID=3365066 RepID=UPI00378CB6CC
MLSSGSVSFNDIASRAGTATETSRTFSGLWVTWSMATARPGIRASVEALELMSNTAVAMARAKIAVPTPTWV